MDSRLKTLADFQTWLEEWRAVETDITEKSSALEKKLLSEKLRFDISSMLYGFTNLCKVLCEMYPGRGITPGRTNSNIVENFFCQQRGKNGQNDNPSYSQYCSTVNGIILGQRTTTRKSNSGNVEGFSFYKPDKLIKNRRRKKLN